ncbi:hypothetical protein [Moraxella oblonga]|uniref:hypothetical protein n=1 Tax=Moraxella oblonga TaxID=200413 RepID=UPI00082C8BA3|nr:hypothetical protein [Moraxella oblonga]
MSNQTVWISEARRWAKYYDISASFPNIDYRRYHILWHKKEGSRVINSKIIFTDKEKQELEVLSELLKQSWKGFSDFRGLSVLPDKLWRTGLSIPKETKHIFKITGSCLILSQACSELLQEFNLGKTGLAKVQIYNMETQEPDDDRIFYYLDMAEWRHYLLPEKSGDTCYYVGYQTNGYDAYQYRGFRDGNLTLSSEALNCDLDLWHDPMLWDSIFISDRLCKALKKAKMFKQFYLKPCDIFTK